MLKVYDLLWGVYKPKAIYYIIRITKNENRKKFFIYNYNGKSVGIDWNCRDDAFITMSNGTKVKCPRFLRSKQKQLAHYQKRMSKMYEMNGKIPTFNYYKIQEKVAKLHEKVAWQRKDC